MKQLNPNNDDNLNVSIKMINALVKESYDRHK